MRTHFYPSALAGSEDAERGPCGTWLGETSELSGDWSRVDCKRCLKDRPAITVSSEAEERAIVEQMGDMAKFMRGQAAETTEAQHHD